MVEDKNFKEPQDIFQETEQAQEPGPVQKEKSETEHVVNEKSVIKPKNNKIFLIIIVIAILGFIGWIVLPKLKISIPANLNNGKEKILSKNQITTSPIIPEKTPTVLDSDHDGLSDKEEKKIGTDPNKVDTDKDGLSDKEEAKIYRSDPLKKDTNGDGILDGINVQKGINPVTGGKLLNLQQAINNL